MTARRLRLRVLLLSVIATGLLLAATPAHATGRSLEWTDVANDATGLPVAYQTGDIGPSTPASQPRLDVLRSKMVSDGATLVWTATYRSLSNRGLGMQRVKLGTGVWYEFKFGYGDGVFIFHLRLDPVSGNYFSLMKSSGDNGFRHLPCYGCTMTANVRTNTVTLQAPIYSIAWSLEGDAYGSVSSLHEPLLAVHALAGYSAGGPPPIGALGWFAATDIAKPAGDGTFRP